MATITLSGGTTAATSFQPLIGNGATAPAMSGAIVIPLPTASGSLDDIRLPILTVSGTLLDGNVSDASPVLPGLTAAGQIDAGSLYSGASTLPMLSVSGDFGTMADIALPRLGLVSSLEAGSVLRAATSIPAISASATLVSDGLADVSSTLPAITLSASVVSGEVLTGAAILPRLALAAQGYSGTVTTASIVLPVFSVSAESYGEYLGTAAIELPMLQLVATASGPATTSTTVYAMNARTSALTEYSNFSFNSATVFNGVQLVANSTGIFALGGNADSGTLIDAYARLGITDFGTLAHKRVPTAYLGARSDGLLRLTLITDERDSYDYEVLTRDSGKLHGNKLKLGRGMRGTYWQAEVGNVSGSDIEIDTLQLIAEPLARKV